VRAVVYDTYGGPDVLRREEVERPVPKDDEVLVRIRATGDTKTNVLVLEYASEGRVVSTGAPYTTRYISQSGFSRVTVCPRAGGSRELERSVTRCEDWRNERRATAVWHGDLPL
jgi:NADPH:quinone reductase-like Zn-dependent oxidoreductase